MGYCLRELKVHVAPASRRSAKEKGNTSPVRNDFRRQSGVQPPLQIGDRLTPRAGRRAGASAAAVEGGPEPGGAGRAAGVHRAKPGELETGRERSVARAALERMAAALGCPVRARYETRSRPLPRRRPSALTCPCAAAGLCVGVFSPVLGWRAGDSPAVLVRRSPAGCRQSGR